MPLSSDGDVYASWALQSAQATPISGHSTPSHPYTGPCQATPIPGWSSPLGHPYTGRELVIRWDEGIRAKFIAWLKTKKRPITDEDYLRKSILSYLDRYFPPEGITRPEQVFEMFMRCQRGRHHLKRALGNLLTFYRRVLGYPRDLIEDLREAMECEEPGEDRWVPSEGLVVQDLRELSEARSKSTAHLKFFILTNAVLDSAVRPEHLIEGLFEDFRPEKLEYVADKGFYKYRLGIERATKNAWVAYLTPYTVELITALYERGQKITRKSIYEWLRRHRREVGQRPDGKPIVMPLRPKVIQKFAMTMMRRAGLDKDVVNWLSGKKPKGVDERHYLDLELLADSQYERYMAYLAELRVKAGLTS